MLFRLSKTVTVLMDESELVVIQRWYTIGWEITSLPRPR